jgi:NADH:ubiquinone oxidoreductase subunit 5 (subunit L)/multisubunit Na+/H+ antiporter MnhA subunit
MIFSLLFFVIFYPVFIFLFFNNFSVFSQIYSFLIKKWYFDLIYNNIFSYGLLNFFYIIPFKLVDRGFIELIGPLGIVRSLNILSLIASRVQTGFIYNYIFTVILGVLLLFYLIFIITDFYSFPLIISFLGVFIFLQLKQWV